jgi:hypothetical protein
MNAKFPEFDEVTQGLETETVTPTMEIRGRQKKRQWFQGKYGEEKDDRVIKSQTLCKFFSSTGSCRNGGSCKFTHEFDDSNFRRKIDEPCKFLYRPGRWCKKGEDCHFSHDLNKYPCPLAFGPKSRSCPEECAFSHTEPSGESSRIIFAKLYKVFLRTLGEEMDERWRVYMEDMTEEEVLEIRTRKSPPNLFNHRVG